MTMIITKFELLARLGEIARLHRPMCMCGHFESCESCNPSSSLNKMADDLRRLGEDIANGEFPPTPPAEKWLLDPAQWKMVYGSAR